MKNFFTAILTDPIKQIAMCTLSDEETLIVVLICSDHLYDIRMREQPIFVVVCFELAVKSSNARPLVVLINLDGDLEPEIYAGKDLCM